MMEKEASTNNVIDDLNRRNRNWDKIETHLADYATLKSEFAQHKLDYIEHLNSNMPHKMKVDGRDYKYGFSQENGFVKFVYEEVI